MAQPQLVERIEVEDYLAGEQVSSIRHEYVDGTVFAMAGASEKHNRIAGNIFFHLRSAARTRPCGVFISDMKVQLPALNAFYYPDVMLVCEAGDADAYYKTSPCLIAEVLSPTTEITDRREKLLAYRTLPSLRYYLLVSQETRRIEMYQRDDRMDAWYYTVIEESGRLDINCGDFQATFSLEDVYEDVL